MIRRNTLGLAAALLTAGCGSYYSDLKIVNRGTASLESVTVAFQGGIQHLGTIAPGSEAVFRAHLKGEGAPMLRFRQQGVMKAAQTCYFTATFPPRGTITILDDRIERRCE